MSPTAFGLPICAKKLDSTSKRMDEVENTVRSPIVLTQLHTEQIRTSPWIRKSSFSSPEGYKGSSLVRSALTSPKRRDSTTERFAKLFAPAEPVVQTLPPLDIPAEPIDPLLADFQRDVLENEQMHQVMLRLSYSEYTEDNVSAWDDLRFWSNITASPPSEIEKTHAHTMRCSYESNHRMSSELRHALKELFELFDTVSKEERAQMIQNATILAVKACYQTFERFSGEAVFKETIRASSPRKEDNVISRRSTDSDLPQVEIKSKQAGGGWDVVRRKFSLKRSSK
jgi:hypothetical protein